MKLLWICFVFVAAVGTVTAFGEDTSDEDFLLKDDYNYNDDWYMEEAEKLGIISSEESKENQEDPNNAAEVADDPNIDDKNDDTADVNDDSDKNVEQEIEMFRELLEKDIDDNSFAPLDDYQIEDNRSEVKDDNEESIVNDDNVVANENVPEENLRMFDETKALLNEENSKEFEGSDVKDIIDSPRGIEDMAKETKELLESIDSDFDEDDGDDGEINDQKPDTAVNKEEVLLNGERQLDETEQNSNDQSEVESLAGDDMDDIVIRLLEENKVNKKADSGESNEGEVSFEDNDVDGNGDAVPISEPAKANADEVRQESNEDLYDEIPALDADDVHHAEEDLTDINNDSSENLEEFDKETVDKVVADLHEDLQKLFDTWEKLSDDADDQYDEIVDDDNVLDYEEKNGKPFREEILLAQRNNGNDYVASDESDEDSEVVDDQANVGDKEVKYVEEKDESDDDEDDEPIDVLDALEKALDDKKYDLEPVESVIAAVEPENEETDSDESTEMSHLNAEIDSVKSGPTDEEVPVNEKLTEAEYILLMQQFKQDHKDDLDTLSDDFSKHVAPIHIKLSVDEPVVVTSPNYPNPYPTNNIVDWIFDGDGIGVELNITDFNVNGLVGDFLLVKPGGADDTNTDGLVFSYHLNDARYYRFLDVDRMFVRFQANLGLPFRTGFQFSVRMVASPPEEPEAEPVQEGEPPLPPALLTLNLGGMTLPQFLQIQEEFRQLVADMATVYINANQIESGLNTTSEVAQITGATMCNINWPNFENCVEVTFGVPLVYDEDEDPTRLTEDELSAMWTTYVYQDPFARRLRRMGISEFAVPDDGRVLLVWLVIGAGIIVSVAMLAFALWRYSCFEDYTRMAAFSDTDSIQNEKRNMDLYPTPHQTLPPLYSDQDYKWADEKYEDATRVDMGGFANQSYVQDELFEIESDDDVMNATRDRFTTDV